MISVTNPSHWARW